MINLAKKPIYSSNPPAFVRQSNLNTSALNNSMCLTVMLLCYMSCRVQTVKLLWLRDCDSIIHKHFSAMCSVKKENFISAHVEQQIHEDSLTIHFVEVCKSVTEHSSAKPFISAVLCVCVQRLKVKWWPWWWCIVGTWLSHLGHAALNWCSTSLRLAPFSTLFLGLHSPPSLHLSNLWDLSIAPLYVCSSALLISIV